MNTQVRNPGQDTRSNTPTTGNNAIPMHPQVAAQISAAQQGTPAPQNPVGNEPSVDEESSNIDFDAIFNGEEDDTQVAPDVGPDPAQVPQTGDALTDLESLAGVEAPAEETPAQQQPQAQQQPNAPVDMNDLETKAIAHLESTLYNLDDETRRKLVTEPDQVMPQLAARLHVQIVKNLATQLPQIVEQRVQQILHVRDTAARAEREFFGKFPQLNRPEFNKDVVQALTTIKTMKPNATREEIEREGAQLAAFNISQRMRKQRPAGQPAQQSRQQPYRPASTVGRGAPPANTPQNAQENFWADFAGDPNW